MGRRGGPLPGVGTSSTESSTREHSARLGQRLGGSDRLWWFTPLLLKAAVCRQASGTRRWVGQGSEEDPDLLGAASRVPRQCLLGG